jgi:adenine-specific DNA-methyltransferase
VLSFVGKSKSLSSNNIIPLKGGNELARESDQNQYSDLTLSYLKTRPKEERSPIGQFITPRILREALVREIGLENGMKVLDPGVGTGEFLATCSEFAQDLELEGWDIDAQAAEVARQLVPKATIKVLSALEQEWSETFDVVIGNPPYFEMRNLEFNLRSKYRDVIGGRPNIFSLFFMVGLGALKKGGRLGYVVPPSMNNGAFFSKLRNFITNTSSIEFLKVYEDSKLFVDAQTAVQLIVLEKGKTSENFILDMGKLGKTKVERKILVESPKHFAREFERRTTLWNLGYEAVTGTLVWNQHKENLRNHPEKNAVPLLWAHNISEEREIVLNENHPKKSQYVISSTFLTGPAIIVNRITGSVGQGSLRCAIVPDGMTFLGENHVNVIRKRRGVKQLVDWEELLRLLRSSGVNERIQRLTGNTQVSCIELTHFLPLDHESSSSGPSTLF